jgi:hypothetical protein
MGVLVSGLCGVSSLRGWGEMGIMGISSLATAEIGIIASILVNAQSGH